MRLSDLRLPAFDAREKRLLAIALLVALLILAFRLWPAVQQGHQQRAAQLETLRLELDRDNRLLEETEHWQAEREGIEQRREQLQEQLFQASTLPLLSAEIQRQVRDLAAAHQLNITATQLAESLQADGWLLVEQRLNFTVADQIDLSRFLEALAQHEPRLAVQRFNLRHTRGQYNGDLTVVGFARSNGGGMDP